MKKEKYLSLFDYLGKAAGSELGKKVADAAISKKIKIDRKEISNSKYKGIILTYPESFLQNYFSETNKLQNNSDLPF